MYFKKVGKWRNPGIKDDNEVDKCVQKFAPWKFSGRKDIVNIYCQSKLSSKGKHETLCVLLVDFIFRGGGEKILGCID